MLPFIAGIATGVVAVVAYNNNKKVKEKVQQGACKVKEYAQTGLEKSKETIEGVKKCIEEKKSTKTKACSSKKDEEC